MIAKLRRLFISLCSILSISALNTECLACAEEDSLNTRTEHYNLNNQTAIQGYDPVAYFTQGKAVKGKPQFSYQHHSVLYLFSSSENLAIFKATPNTYEPQYGGWCAYALAVDGGKVSINPKRFKIIDNKLYLFYDTILGPNTLNKWNKANDTDQIKKADLRWMDISK